MTLVYRAIWEDGSVVPAAILDEQFRSWCESKNIAIADIPYRGRFDAHDRLWIEVRRADAEIGKAMRCTLSEKDPRGRTWTTTATVLADSKENTFWVDLECDDPSGSQPEMAAPRLVRQLIACGGFPTSYGLSITTSAQPTGLVDIQDLIDILIDSNRLIPIVVFSSEYGSRTPDVINRANAAAETLAGLAKVYVLSTEAVRTFNSRLPDGFGVFGGAVRMYLAPLHTDDPDDIYRHRWIPLRLIANHPRRAASLLANRLARLQLHSPIPDSWTRLGGLLRGPTLDEIEDRASEIGTHFSETPTDDSFLRAEIVELTNRLAESCLINEQLESSTGAEIVRLETIIREADDIAYIDADELERQQQEINDLRREFRIVARSNTRETTPPTSDPYSIPSPESTEDAISLARTYLPFLEIPQEATQTIDELDSSPKYSVWALTVWQGLLALNAYAQEEAAGDRIPGLYLWCQESGNWPQSKLAMRESDTVMKSTDLSRQRNFTVARDVDPSGQTHTYAHLKIQSGGNQSIPRLYFHDDTDGITKHIHIGFIGPHRYVSNTKT